MTPRWIRGKNGKKELTRGKHWVYWIKFGRIEFGATTLKIRWQVNLPVHLLRNTFFFNSHKTAHNAEFAWNKKRRTKQWQWRRGVSEVAIKGRRVRLRRPKRKKRKGKRARLVSGRQQKRRRKQKGSHQRRKRGKVILGAYVTTPFACWLLFLFLWAGLCPHNHCCLARSLRKEKEEKMLRQRRKWLIPKQVNRRHRRQELCPLQMDARKKTTK